MKVNIEYPDSDGEPIGETDLHTDDILYLRFALRNRYHDAPDVYVAGALLFFYQEGDPKKFIVPDVFVAWGVSKRSRRNYLLWTEGVVPRVTVEATSAASAEKDLGFKKDLYERLGVEEYFLFDPYREYLRPPLQGFRLDGRRYLRIPEEPDGSLLSSALGVAFRWEDSRLRLTDLDTGAPLLRQEEVAAACQGSEERVRALEAEIARLRGDADHRPS